MGQLVRVIPETDYTFDGRASGTAQDVVLASRISSVDWASGVLCVRFHTKSWTSTTCTVDVLVQNVMFAEEEPQTLFVSAASAVATASIANADAAPKYILTAFSSPIGPMVRVLLRYTQGSSAPGASGFSIAVDLVGRS